MKCSAVSECKLECGAGIGVHCNTLQKGGREAIKIHKKCPHVGIDNKVYQGLNHCIALVIFTSQPRMGATFAFFFLQTRAKPGAAI